MAFAANCYRLGLLSTVLFNRFFSSPSLPPFHTLPSAAPWYTPPPTSAPSPSATLRSRGYFLMAGILDYAYDTGGNHAGWNGSGTLFAPSDSAFRNYLRLPPYPTPSILLYHTARMPSLLSVDIAIMPPGSSLPTLSRLRRCVFFRLTAAGELCIAETPFRRSKPCVKIREPDLFHDGNLAIHGINGVLDPSIAYPCGPGTRRSSPHLDAAVTALRRKGYFAVADAMLVRRSELARLPAVTVFAPSYIDGDADGFREALGRHVIPRRYDLHDLASLSMGQRIQTIASNREIVVGFDAEGTVTVDGISIDGDAIYRNRWAVILPVRRQIGSSRTPHTPEESPLASVSGPLGNDGPAFGPSNDYLQESSNDETKKAGEGGQSDNSLTHGVDPAVISPDELCHANATPSVRHIAPCPAFDTPPTVGDAATTAISDL